MIYARRYYFFCAMLFVLAIAGMLAGPENAVLRAVLIYSSLACVPFAAVNAWKSGPARIARRQAAAAAAAAASTTAE